MSIETGDETSNNHNLCIFVLLIKKLLIAEWQLELDMPTGKAVYLQQTKRIYLVGKAESSTDTERC